MLAHIMFFDEEWIHRSFRIDTKTNESHLGTLLHYLGIVNSICRRSTPTKWTVIFNKDSMCVVGINSLKTLDDDVASL